MIIDFHNHLGIDLGAELDQGSDQLLRRMEEASIERTVVFPFPGCPVLEEANTNLVRACNRHKDRLIPFLGINPREHQNKTTAEVVDMLWKQEARGVIVDPTMHHFSLTSSIVDPLLKGCAVLRLPLIVHLVGHGMDNCYPITQLALRHPSTSIVASPLIHCPGWQALSKNCTNLYADTAMAIYPEQIAQLVQTLGPERVIFGSETPYMCPTVELAKLDYVSFSDDVKQRVLWRTAASLLVF